MNPAAMQFKLPKPSRTIIRHWPILLLSLLIFILILHKYVFPLSPYYPQIDNRPQITLYSNPTYYNAVLPWLSFNQKQRKFQLTHKIWMNIARLQFQIRHNQGEFWITSLEGAAQAWHHNADLKILMIMGWKKWNLISSLSEEELHATPPKIIYYPLYNNSVKNVLKETFKNQDTDAVDYRAIELPKLLDKMLAGELETAVLQTPLCAYVQMSQKKIKTNISLDRLYLEKSGKITRFPWIVLAVRGQWARSNPELLNYIIKQLRRESYILNLMPVQDVSKIWESKYESDIPVDVLKFLLKYEKLQSIPAYEAEEQIKFLLKLTCPHINYSPNLLWHPPIAPK